MTGPTDAYRFLPFRFEKKGERVLLVNDVGGYSFLDRHRFKDFINRHLDTGSPEYSDLQSAGFLYSQNPAKVIDWLATRYRTKKQSLFDFTALHMFVVTQRCNQSCGYCHASSIANELSGSLDMCPEIARCGVEMAFRSPSRHIKIELQGGEPLLNFPAVKAIVECARNINQREVKKEVEIVLCTNLIDLDSEIIGFLKDNEVWVSTSLDGTRNLHDACRRLADGGGSYDRVIDKLDLLRNELGWDKVSALTTVTRHNINCLSEVVDEYLRLGFRSIFLRMLNPFGRAFQGWDSLGYTTVDFTQAYAETFEYILAINRSGTYFQEEYATLLLTRILTPFSTGFVDLQSPAGCGISGVIYDINGDIYVSDEARMLARMGDKRFRIGNVQTTPWKEAFGSVRLREIIENSCIESLPGCAWCVYQPYCGTDPVRNYAQGGDLVSHKPMSDFCQFNRSIFNVLFDYLEKGDEKTLDVFWSWITARNLEEIWRE